MEKLEIRRIDTNLKSPERTLKIIFFVLGIFLFFLIKKLLGM